MARRSVKQAGAIAFRTDGDQPRILLVRAKRPPHPWIFPKGHIEPGESSAETALRELEEEAGVTGQIVMPVCPPLEFNDDERKRVRVQYYLVVLKQDGPAREGREKQWLEPSEALQTLAHDDARALLRRGLRDIRKWPAQAVSPADGGDAAGDEIDRDELRELLLAEYAHAGESLLRNEEDGEKRVAFFVTLVAGILAAFGFLVGDNGVLKGDAPLVRTFAMVALAPLAILVAFGYLTFARVVARNVASDRYKEGMNRIRRFFVTSPAVARYLAFDPFAPPCRKPVSFVPFKRGGWLETVAVVESLLVGLLFAVNVMVWTVDPSDVAAVGAGVKVAVAAAGAGATVVAWLLLMLDANRRYREHSEPES